MRSSQPCIQLVPAINDRAFRRREGSGTEMAVFGPGDNGVEQDLKTQDRTRDITAKPEKSATRLSILCFVNGREGREGNRMDRGIQRRRRSEHDTMNPSSPSFPTVYQDCQDPIRECGSDGPLLHVEYVNTTYLDSKCGLQN